MDNLTPFFEKFLNLLNIHKEKEDLKTKRGENFNIFNVLKVTTQEVKLHSALIAELLNPLGYHGLGIKPLKSFLLKIGYDKFSDEDLKHARVDAEYVIGSISEDHSTGGSIDILVDINGSIVAIENKINAGDQHTQMFRYHNFCKSFEYYRLLYLTLDRHRPTDNSLNGLEEKTHYDCISYGCEIAEWVRECIGFASSLPPVRETLRQYLKTILILTNQDMDKDEELHFYELMSDHPEVVAKVVNLQWGYRQYLVDNYVISPFEKWSIENGFKFYKTPELLNQGKEELFGIYRPEWKKMIALEFEMSDFRKPAYGVYKWESHDETRGNLFGKKDEDSWPYGWEPLDKYTAWDVSICEDIKTGKVFEYVKGKFEEIIKKLDKDPEHFPMD